MTQTILYPNCIALAAAFESGALSHEEWHLVIDNDESYLTWIGDAPAPEDADHDTFWHQKDAEAKSLFHGNGLDDIFDMAAAAGIPAVTA